ncbi:MAG: LexA repressor [Solobacterium sp.]|nr:LexA repressor [Solobacterium sp.]
MITLQEIVKDYIQKTGISYAELGRKCGVNRTTAARWGSGQIRKLYGDQLQRLSDLVGYDVEYVLSNSYAPVKMPVLGYVRAGYDLFAEENYLGEEETSLDDARRADYFLKVTGDSMSGIGILDGSLVLVKKCDTIDSGKIGVVLVGDEVTVKRVVYEKNALRLAAANPDYEDRIFSMKDIETLPVRIIGKVISCKTYF